MELGVGPGALWSHFYILLMLRARYLLPNFILIFLFIYYWVYCDRLDVPVMAIATYLYLGNIDRVLPVRYISNPRSYFLIFTL